MYDLSTEEIVAEENLEQQVSQINLQRKVSNI